MENFEFSDRDRENDAEDQRNKISGGQEDRLEIFRQMEVPADEICNLLRDLRGKFTRLVFRNHIIISFI